jgi:hypothetical protein
MQATINFKLKIMKGKRGNIGVSDFVGKKSVIRNLTPKSNCNILSALK